MNFPNRIIIGSDGDAIYSMYTINTLLKIAYPEAKIEWNDHKPPHLVIKSVFPQFQKHPGYSCPYITWTGETRSVQHLNYPPICEIKTHIDDTDKSSLVPIYHIPYCHNYVSATNFYLDYCDHQKQCIDWQPHEYQLSPELLSRHEPTQRPYFCAYLSVNPVKEREKMWNLLLKRSSDLTCHALGSCSNNLEQIKKNPEIWVHVSSYANEKNYRKNPEIFRHYRFALVMENQNVYGYVTEKIVNAFKAGTIPIYWGSQGFVNTLFNPRAFINVDQYASFEECVDDIIKLDHDPDRLLAMQSEPIFLNNSPPEIFKGLTSNYLKPIADQIKNCLNHYYQIDHDKKHNDLKLDFSNRYSQIDGIDQIIWINLDRCRDRFDQMQQLLNQPTISKIPNYRLVATDAQQVNPLSNFELTPKMRLAQYACLHSHLRAILYAYENQYNQVLIMEDDNCLDFSPIWDQSLSQIMKNAPSDWQIIMLSYTSLKQLQQNYTRWNFDPSGNWQYNFNGTLAYLINRQGMKAIIDRLWKNSKWNLPMNCNHVADEVLYVCTQTYIYKYPYFIWHKDSSTTVGNHDEYLYYHNQVRDHFCQIFKINANINQPRKWFIHYFESKNKFNPETFENPVFSTEAGYRIANEVKALNEINYVITYRKRDLDSSFINRYQSRFALSRGAGYWIWKPEIILMTLEKMNWGDEMMYGDTGCEIKGSLQPLFNLLQKNDIVSFHLEDFHTEQRWTKNDLFIELDMDDQIHRLSPQRLSGYFLIRKTPLVVKLFQQFSQLIGNLHLIDDSPSITPNHSTFQEHRHDQSVWSLLCKKYHVPAYPDCGWPPQNSTTIAASRIYF